MFKHICISIIGLVCVAGCKTIDKIVDSEKPIKVKGINMNLAKEHITYISFINSVIEYFNQNNFRESDPILGKLTPFSHKTNNYKNDLASYRQTIYNNDIRINLTKKRESQVWQHLMLSNSVGSINDFLPELPEDFFYKNSALVKIEVKYDPDFDTYNYIYVYKNRVRLTFIVREQDFNHEAYPKNYKAIKMTRI